MPRMQLTASPAIFTVIRDQSVLESISGLAKAYMLTTDLGRDSDLFDFLDRPRLPHLLPCACPHPDFGEGEGAMDCRRTARSQPKT